MNAEQRNALLEIMDDRYGEILDGRGQSAANGRVVRELGDNTLADAILDRLMHNAHRLSLEGRIDEKEEK